MSKTPDQGISPTEAKLAAAKNAGVLDKPVTRSLGRTFNATDLPSSHEGQHVVRGDGHSNSSKRKPGHN